MPKRIPYLRPIGTSKRDLYDSSPDRKENKAFYSGTRWRKARAAYLSDGAHCLCVDCLKQEPPRYTATKDIHHDPPRRQLPPEDWYDPKYWVMLCHSCHSKRTKKEQNNIS